MDFGLRRHGVVLFENKCSSRMKALLNTLFFYSIKACKNEITQDNTTNYYYEEQNIMTNPGI